MEIVAEKPTRVGGWIQTYMGIAFYPLDPREEDVHINDISHALSLTCRFAGHCRVFYSVAEHCCHVSDWLPDEFKLAGLLHDASEAYLMDVPKPIKSAMGNYVDIEKNLEMVIFNKYDLPFPFAPIIKEADNRILIDERDVLLSKPIVPWLIEPEPLGIEIQCWSPERAKQEYMSRFHKLV